MNFIKKYYRQKQLNNFLKIPYKKTTEFLNGLNEKEYKFLLEKGEINKLYDKLLKFEKIIYEHEGHEYYERDRKAEYFCSENVYIVEKNLYYIPEFQISHFTDKTSFSFFTYKGLYAKKMNYRDSTFYITREPNPFIIKEDIDDIYQHLIIKRNFNLEKFKFHPNYKIRQLVATKKEYFDFFIENKEEHPEVIQQLISNNYKIEQVIENKIVTINQIILCNKENLKYQDKEFLKLVLKFFEENPHPYYNETIPILKKHLIKMKKIKEGRDSDKRKREREKEQLDKYFTDNRK